MHLDDLRLYVRVAQAGSLSAAARQLGLSPAAVSAAIKRIEAAQRVRLIERSTRALRLTPEGETFLDGCLRILDQWEQTRSALQDGGAAHGEVRISAPSDTAHSRLSPWLAEWQRTHPGVNVTLLVSDRVQDLMRESVDIAVRYGVLADSGLVARPLCSGPRIIVAAPDYLKKHGTPKTPDELTRHHAVFLLIDGRPYRDWPLWRGRQQQATRVRMQGNLCGNGQLVRQWALQGRGLASKALVDVIDDLEAGRLVQVLPDHHGGELPVQAVLPGRGHTPQRVRELLVLLTGRYAELHARMQVWRGRKAR
ncbi:MAG: LysR family transcriptional regulator [Solimonas sp.]